MGFCVLNHKSEQKSNWIYVLAMSKTIYLIYHYSFDFNVPKFD